MVDMLGAFDAVVEEGLIEEVKSNIPIDPKCRKYPATSKWRISDRQRKSSAMGETNCTGKPVLNVQMKLEGVVKSGYDALDGSGTTFIKAFRVTPGGGQEWARVRVP